MLSYLAPLSLSCDRRSAPAVLLLDSTPNGLKLPDYALPLCLKTSIFPPKTNKNPLNSRPSLKSFSTKLNLKERALSDCRWARTCNPKLVCGYLGHILFQSLRTT